VVIHSLTDDRRSCRWRTGELLHAHPTFSLVISYNPGYQSVLKDLKESTKQRFAALPFGYPDAARRSRAIVMHESGVDEAIAEATGDAWPRARATAQGPATNSTKAPPRACSSTPPCSIAAGVPIMEACQVALVIPITDDDDLRDALTGAIAACV
jgi:nitric oxide reductase NorQ protein